MELTSQREIKDIKDTLTITMLAIVGLKIVDDKKDMIPWYIPLSSVQRSWVNTVHKNDYKVGLT